MYVCVYVYIYTYIHKYMFAACLRKNNALVVLNLKANYISDSGATAIAQVTLQHTAT